MRAWIDHTVDAFLVAVIRTLTRRAAATREEALRIESEIVSLFHKQLPDAAGVPQASGHVGGVAVEAKTLQGLMTICTHCKRIKNEEGRWTRLEQYLEANANVRFTHFLCPDCFRSLYPGIEDEESRRK